MIIVPLIVSSIISGVTSIGSAESFGRLSLKTFFYYITTSLMAIITGLFLVNIIKPGVGAKLGLQSIPSDLSANIEKIIAGGHKVLIFSQFVKHLNLIRKYLDEKKIAYRYLDGSTPKAKRQAEISAFQDGQANLFLISLKAGGLGLNLTAADYVLHLDPWWNPAIEDQASDRAHRIGQTRPVTVYRLISHHTIEEKIVRLHQEKRNLADQILSASDQSARFSTAELLQLIKEG